MPAFSNYAQEAMVSARRSILRFVAFLGIVASPSVFAAVDVTASVPSGTYDRIVSVELRATDPAAKIFYTFEPDGPPDAGYMYTGAIRIARSTPLMFFAVVSDDDSSLIKREDYVLAYPRDLTITNISSSAFGDVGHANYSVRNASSATVDLGGWYFRLAS